MDRSIREEGWVPEAALMENAAAGMQAALAGQRALAGNTKGVGCRERGVLTALVGRGGNGGDAAAVLRRIAFENAGGSGPELAIILSSGRPSDITALQVR
ncbi:MAG TPA: hypothetical protein VLH39_00225, partial [Magnetospirillaceae bacterium]|nr:hypothetical protein [Magnetospirillaceae bacterium]